MKDIETILDITQLSDEQRELLTYLLEDEGIALPSIAQISPRDNSDELPLSFAQQRLWFLDQLMPGTPVYNIPAAVQITGALNPIALEQSLNEIVQRHEALRTRFLTVEQQPVQIIEPQVVLSLPLIDLRELPETERQIQTEQLAQAAALQPFDLSQGPLLRAQLLCLSADEHVLLLTLHHIVADGWSLGVLVRELAALYEAFSTGTSTSLPQLPIQYADFALWQRQWLQGDRLETQLNYWKQQLSGRLPILELPTDRPRPMVQTFRGARRSVQLPKALSEAIANLSQQAGVTVFITLLTAFQALLHRYTGQTDILVGAPIANRHPVETEPLIGCFVNTLVFRTNLEGNPSFHQLLGQVRQVVLEGYDHADLPFEKLVETLQPERSLSHSPLFQVMFALQNAPMPALEFSGLTLDPLNITTATAKFDLMLDLTETDEGLHGWFEYNADLFDSTTLDRLVTHFQTLLAGIVDNPDQRLSDLPILSTAERQQLLIDWNDTPTPSERHACLHHGFEAQVERSPDAIAVVWQDQSLTYRDLNQRANRLAHYLQTLKVEPDVAVGLFMERSLEMVIGVLAILKAGGAYVPLDPSYPPDRLALTLQDAQVPILLTQTSLLPNLPPHSATVICLDTDLDTNLDANLNAALDTSGATLNHVSDQNPSSPVLPTHQAYILYTSGSTGQPKGVVIEHRNTTAFLAWVSTVFTPEQLAIVLASTSICFDLSVFELFAPLSCGGKVILAKNALHLPTLPEAETVTLINTVPSAMVELLRVNGIPASVRTINLAGEPLSKQVVQQIYEQTSVQQVFNLYGPSEDTTYSTYKLVKSADDIISIGRPIANTQVYSLDHYLQPAPIGVPGELYIAGEGLARAYLHRPDLTAEKFIPNPFSAVPGSRLYRTGDRVRYLPTGDLEYLGRLDHQVKIRGFRIELGEIEAVLSQHPAVQQVVVIAQEMALTEKIQEKSPENGQINTANRQQLVAYVVPHPDMQPTISDLRSHLQQHLPDYMVPSSFVLLAAFPLTPNGKIDRRALPSADLSRCDLATTFVAPRTPLETTLAEMWSTILGVSQIGIHDHFFELGGHSLLATQVVHQVRTTFQVELPLLSLFEEPTVAGLAKAIERYQSLHQSVYQTDHQSNHQPDHQAKPQQTRALPKIQAIPREKKNVDQLSMTLNQLSDDELKTIMQSKQPRRM